MSQSLLEQNVRKLEKLRNDLKQQSDAINDEKNTNLNPEDVVKLGVKLERYYHRVEKIDTELKFLKDQLEVNEAALVLEVPPLKVAIIYKDTILEDQQCAEKLEKELPDLLDDFALVCVTISLDDAVTLPDNMEQYQGIILIVSQGLRDVALKINALSQKHQIVIALAVRNPEWKAPFGLHSTEIDFTHPMAIAKLVGKLAPMQGIALKQSASLPSDTEVSLEDEHWKSLIDRLQKNKCVAIIGPDLIDNNLPSEKYIVERLVGQAGKYTFDIGGDRSLARVLEYLQHVDLLVRNAVIEELVEILSSGITKGDDDANEDEAHSKIIGDVVNVNVLLAQLPCSIYVTVNHDDRLVQALNNAGKSPQPIVDPFNKENDAKFEIASEQTPVVVYLLGTHASNDIVNEIALESEYMELIHEISVEKKKLSVQLQSKFGNNALMFLGFDIHHIAFQTIYWILYPYIERRNDLLIVAPTISIADNGKPERVARFLKQYLLTKNMQTYINVNSGRDSEQIENPVWFLLDLEHKWKEHQQNKTAVGEGAHE